jgi:hypothetical protein
VKIVPFIGAIAAGLFLFEFLDGAVLPLSSSGRLRGVGLDSTDGFERRKSSWDAVLLLLLPGYFGPGAGFGGSDVAELLCRAGYPFRTTGDYIAASIRTFTIFLIIGGVSAGLLLSANIGLPVSIGSASIFVLLGLRQPYSQLRKKIRNRASALKNNMLTGLAVLNALLTAGVSVQESLRRSASVGGPFCNLLGLLVAQMEVVPFSKAAEITEAHLPEPEDVEAVLFLRAVRDFYNRNRPLLPAVQGLQKAVHREVLETTESRAAMVRQRSGLFGVLAVLGLVITIIAPFMGVII